MTSNKKVTILILVDGFLQYEDTDFPNEDYTVTILILVDGFLQFDDIIFEKICNMCHNPYFSRWFSAIQNKVNQSIFEKVTILILVDGFLQ